MLGPDYGIGSARVVVARRVVSLLSNRDLGVWITWTRNLCCGTISRLWTKNSLIGFSSGEFPLVCGPMRWDPPKTPRFRGERGPKGIATISRISSDIVWSILTLFQRNDL